MATKFNKGSKLDNSQSLQEQGSWRAARNIVHNHSLTSIKNEEGFNLYINTVNGNPATVTPYRINGIIPVGNETVIFSTNDTISEIGFLDETGAYTTIVRTVLFGFLIENPIEGKYFKNYKGEIIISWWDGVNTLSKKPKILNINTLPFAVDGVFELVDADKIVLSYLFPEFILPNFELIKVVKGGGLIPSGVYYFTISYLLNEFDQTNYTQFSNPIPIGLPFNLVDAFEGLSHGANQIVSQTIHLRITNLDIRYQKYKISTLRRAGNIYTAHDVITRPITLTGIDEFIYTGLHENDIQTTEELIGLRTSFEKVKTGTETLNKLVVGNVDVKPKINYQKYANNIKTTWVTEVSDSQISNEFSDGASASVIYSLKGVMPDEISALYIGFVFKDGTYSEGFHIPGRRPAIVDIDNTLPDLIGDVLGAGCEDMGTMTGNLTIIIEFPLTPGYIPGSYYVTNDPLPTVTILGITYNIISTSPSSAPPTFGILQNFILDVPCSPALIAAITGTPATFVFVIPPPLLENANASDFYSINQYELDMADDLKYFHLRETADVGGVMGFWENATETYPDLDAFDVWDGTGLIDSIRNEKVRHHKLPCTELFHNTGDFYAKFSLGIVFSDIYIPTEIEDLVQSFYFMHADRGVRNSTVLGGSFILPGVSNTNLNTAVTKHGFRMYSFHLLVDKPAIGVHYLKSEFWNGFNGYMLDSQLTSLIGGFDIASEKNIPVTGYEYLEEDNVAHTLYNNQGREACLFLSVDYIYFSLFTAFGAYESLSALNSDIVSAGGAHDTAAVTRLLNPRYATLKVLAYDLYVSFYGQDLISSNYFFPTTGVNLYNPIDEVYNWDIFNGERIQFIKFNVVTPTQTSGFAVRFALRIKHREYSYFNLYYREAEKRNIELDASVGHLYPYDYSYNSVNRLKVPIPYNPYIDYVDKLRFRVYLSNTQQDESKQVAWRIFLLDSYYEMPRNKGVIWTVRGADSNLYIQMRNALFYTSTKDVIQTDELVAYLKSSDLFERPPKEVITVDEGYIGCGDMFASIIIPNGYVVYDKDRKQLIVVEGAKAEIISDNGYKDYFLTYGGSSLASNNDDNPFTIKGSFIVYDDKYKRIIFAKNRFEGETLPFTLSYSFNIKGFNSFHDYYPHMMYSQRNGVFAVSTSQIYKTNQSNKAQYIGGFVYPSYIDIVFNNPIDIIKLFRSVNWETEVRNSSNVELHNETFTSIMIYNNNKCSGRILLNQNLTWFNPVNRNIRGRWSVSKFRNLVANALLPFLDDTFDLIITNIDANKTFFEKSKFISNFVTVRFEYDNVDQNTINLLDVDYKYEPYRK
jgi:hypothetical protein